MYLLNPAVHCVLDRAREGAVRIDERVFNCWGTSETLQHMCMYKVLVRIITVRSPRTSITMSGSMIARVLLHESLRGTDYVSATRHGTHATRRTRESESNSRCKDSKKHRWIILESKKVIYKGSKEETRNYPLSLSLEREKQNHKTDNHLNQCKQSSQPSVAMLFVEEPTACNTIHLKQEKRRCTSS